MAFRKSFQKNSEVPKKDFRADVTNAVIEALEKGVSEWRKPWAALSSPFNPVSKTRYRGGNHFWLTWIAAARGYSDPRWLTYNQASENGWQVRKGSKGVQIEFWQFINKDKQGNLLPDERIIHRVYTVFNASCVDGIPAYDPTVREIEPVDAAEAILNESGASISYGGDRAYYRPSTDEIRLPERNSFESSTAFYAVALHELGHWTGHPTRLNRLVSGATFGSPEYAKEELRAELASLFLQSEIGLPYDNANQAAYIGNWLEVLRKDKNEIFRAAKDAEAILDYLLKRGKERAEEVSEETSEVSAVAA